MKLRLKGAVGNAGKIRPFREEPSPDQSDREFHMGFLPWGAPVAEIRIHSEVFVADIFDAVVDIVRHHIVSSAVMADTAMVPLVST